MRSHHLVAARWPPVSSHWHGAAHLKGAWLKALTAILPLSPSFYVWPPGRGDFSVSNFHPGAIPGNLVRNDSGGEEVLAGKCGGLFWATSLGKNFLAA